MDKKIPIKALVAIFSEDESKILFQYDRQKPEFLRFPGGKVKAGETLERCLERELSDEEFGIRIAGTRPWIVCENLFSYSGEKFHELVIIHSAKLVNGVTFPLSHRETEGIRLDWFEISGLSQRKVVPNGISSFLSSPRESIQHFSNFGFD